MHSEDYEDYFNTLTKKLHSCRICRKWFAKGFSREEIATAEEILNVEFPAAYKCYLRVLGRYSGNLFVGGIGSFKTIDSLIDTTNALRECLQDDGYTDYKKAVSVYDHQCYVFSFIVCSRGDSNPAVYDYKEHHLESVKIAKSNYTDWIDDYLRYDNRCW